MSHSVILQQVQSILAPHPDHVATALQLAQRHGAHTTVLHDKIIADFVGTVPTDFIANLTTSGAIDFASSLVTLSQSSWSYSLCLFTHSTRCTRLSALCSFTPLSALCYQLCTLYSLLSTLYSVLSTLYSVLSALCYQICPSRFRITALNYWRFEIIFFLFNRSHDQSRSDLI